MASATTTTPSASRMRTSQTAATRRLTRIGRPWQLGLLAASVALVNFLLNVHGGYVYDDWLYFSLSRQTGHFSEHWLTSVYFQHFAPGHRLATALQDALPLAYVPVLALMCTGLGGAAYLFGRVCDLLWGPRLLSLGAVVVFGLSIAWTSAINWWSASLQMVPAALASLSVVYGYLRWQRDPRRRWLLVMFLALPLGLMFYIRPVLVIGYVVLLRVFVLEDSVRPRAVVAGLWKDRVPLLVIAAPTAGYLAYYLSLGASRSAARGVTVGQALGAVRVAYLDAVAPALVGVRVLPGAGVTGFQDAAVAASQVLLVALLAFTIARRPGSWRAWAFVAIVFLADVLLTVVPRLGSFGTSVAYSLRYYTDLAWLIPLGLGSALVPGRRARAAAQPDPSRPGPALLAAGGALLAAFCVLSVRTTHQTNREWPGGAARMWTSTLRRSVSLLPTNAVISDARTPDYVLYRDYPPYNRLSSFLPIDRVHRQVDGALPDPSLLYGINPNGTAFFGRFVRRGGGAAGPLVAAGQLTVTGGAQARREGQEVCVAAGASAGQLAFTPPRPVRAAPGSQSLSLRVVGASASPIQLPFQRLPRPDRTHRQDLALTLDRGEAPRLLWLDARAIGSLRFDVPPGADVCLRDVELGSVVPR